MLWSDDKSPCGFSKTDIYNNGSSTDSLYYTGSTMVSLVRHPFMEAGIYDNIHPAANFIVDKDRA